MTDRSHRLRAFAPPGVRTEGGVLLVPLAPYHLDELVPLADALTTRGVGATLATVEPAPKPLGRWRTQTRFHRRLVGALAARGRTALGPPVPATELIAAHSALVVMNDWDWYRGLVEEARSLGLPTLGKVEGVQDFDDVDTGRERRAYRTVDHVLLQGENDRAALADRPGTVVGSCRIERILARPPVAADSELVVVNCNFTYGVLTEHRRAWLASVAAGCAAADRRFVVSRHGADRGWIDPRWVSRRPVEELLAEAGALVTRFSTLGYEALARGIELVYHNPHGERVPTFRESGGAFGASASAGELAAILGGLPASPPVRERAAGFLAAQVDVDPDRPSEERAADAVLRALGG